MNLEKVAEQQAATIQTLKGRPDVEALIEQQAAVIQALQAKMHAWESRFGTPMEDDIPAPGGPLPAIVYKQVAPSRKHVDHPGNISKKVLTQKQLDAALADGWSPTPFEYKYADPDEEPLPKKAAKKGEK